MGMETTLPGDLATLDTIGMGEGEPIWDRMAKIIRSRRLDCRQLMAGFDRAHKGFFDLATLRRALSNAFGNQWTELAMTQAEFAEITEPYLTRAPLQNGEPMALVQFLRATVSIRPDHELSCACRRIWLLLAGSCGRFRIVAGVPVHRVDAQQAERLS